MRCVERRTLVHGAGAHPGTLVSLDRMVGVVAHDGAAQTAVCRAGTRLAQLSRQLDRSGWALANLPDIDAQSLAGAISTATHGTRATLGAARRTGRTGTGCAPTANGALQAPANNRRSSPPPRCRWVPWAS